MVKTSTQERVWDKVMCTDTQEQAVFGVSTFRVFYKHIELTWPTNAGVSQNGVSWQACNLVNRIASYLGWCSLSMCTLLIYISSHVSSYQYCSMILGAWFVTISNVHKSFQSTIMYLCNVRWPKNVLFLYKLALKLFQTRHPVPYWTLHKLMSYKTNIMTMKRSDWKIIYFYSPLVQQAFNATLHGDQQIQ